MLIFSGSSNPLLANKIADITGNSLGEISIESFANGEKRVWVQSDVRGKQCAIVQSFSQPVDSHIMEFLLIADALERAGSRRVIAVIPWMGYSLQDKVFREGEPIAARVVADLVSHAFCKRAIVLDLHNSSIAGFFSVPTMHLKAISLFEKYVRDNFDLKKVIVVSPDFGGIKPARVFADRLAVDLANVDKARDLSTGQIETMGLSGNVKDKICLVPDDVINTGGTVVEVAKFLKSKGAAEVHFTVTHGLFAGEGLKKMADPAIDSVVITDSVMHKSLPKKIKVLSVAEMFSKALE